MMMSEARRAYDIRREKFVSQKSPKNDGERKRVGDGGIVQEVDNICRVTSIKMDWTGIA